MVVVFVSIRVFCVCFVCERKVCVCLCVSLCESASVPPSCDTMYVQGQGLSSSDVPPKLSHEDFNGKLSTGTENSMVV